MDLWSFGIKSRNEPVYADYETWFLTLATKHTLLYSFDNTMLSMTLRRKSNAIHTCPTRRQSQSRGADATQWMERTKFIPSGVVVQISAPKYNILITISRFNPQLGL